MAKSSEKPVKHTFKGVEVWAQRWYAADCNDLPKLVVGIGDFNFCDTVQYAPGKWCFGDDAPAPGNCGNDDFPAMLSAYGIAKSFLAETVIE